MTDPIRAALDRLNDRLLPTLFGEGVSSAFLQAWTDEARAALATRPPAGDDYDRAALEGLLDRVHLAATDPAAWLGLKQGGCHPPAPSPAIDAGFLQAITTIAHEAWNASGTCATPAAQPPSPAASTTPDLDALLSPEGAYERGTGHEDGAQLVYAPHGNGPEWWAPLYGRDTLDNLLDRIGERILPYLRPPVAGIDVPGPDGDYGDVMDLCAAEGVACSVGVPLLNRAREAWKVAAATPAHTPAPALDADTLKEVFAKAIARNWQTGWPALADYVALAVEAQRAPSGNPPATEESWEDAQRTVAERNPSHIAVSLLQLAAVNARQSRWLSSALCERAAKLIPPASDGEREKLASELEDLADTFDQGTPEERALERAAAILRQPAPSVLASDGEREELAGFLDSMAELAGENNRLHEQADLARSATLLRQPAPAVAPVAVAERPWEREGWLNTEKTWICTEKGWSWATDGGIGWYQVPAESLHAWPFHLPHWAISMPQPSHGGEVQP